MQHLKTHGIVLHRVQYGEADRIVTVITPDMGKLSFIAKGVRKIRSKLSGGIELFSVNELVIMPGKSSLGTLTSSRLVHHYGNITSDIHRTTYAYEALKHIHTVTEENADETYFYMLMHTLEALHDTTAPLVIVKAWFPAQLLKVSGHLPELAVDTAGERLEEGKTYSFDFDRGMFQQSPGGGFGAREIRALRLLFSDNTPAQLAKVDGLEAPVKQCMPLLTAFIRTHLPTPK